MGWVYLLDSVRVFDLIDEMSQFWWLIILYAVDAGAKHDFTSTWQVW